MIHPARYLQWCVAGAISCVAATPAQAASIRGLALPAEAVVDTFADRAMVTANVNGDVTAIASLGARRRIITWDAAGNRRVLEPPAGSAGEGVANASTDDGVIAPDGTVYGIAAYPFDGAYIGINTSLYAWRAGSARRIAPSCQGPATNLHPTAVAADGLYGIGTHDGVSEAFVLGA